MAVDEVVELATLTVGGLTLGTRVYVREADRDFVLRASTAFVDHSSAETALDNGGLRWLIDPATYGPSGALGYYTDRAIARLGLRDPSLRLIWHSDFGADGNIVASGIGGGTTNQGIFAAGGIQLNSAGGTTGQGASIGNFNAGTVGLISDIVVRRYYGVWIFKLNVAPSANTRIYGFFGEAPNGANRLGGGVNGTTQTAKFAFSVGTNDGAGTGPVLDVLSTVSPLVGPWYAMELWNDGEGCWGSVNGESDVFAGLTQQKLSSSAVGSSFLFESRPNSGPADSPTVDFGALWVEA